MKSILMTSLLRLPISAGLPGHIDAPHYSVAEHSERGSYYLDTPEQSFMFLMHDAAEAYLVDLPRPIKRTGLLGWLYRKYEAQLERLIAQAYGLPYPLPPIIKEIDKRMLATERRDIRAVRLARESSQPFAEVIEPWSSAEAERRFRKRFSELLNKTLEYT